MPPPSQFVVVAVVVVVFLSGASVPGRGPGRRTRGFSETATPAAAGSAPAKKENHPLVAFDRPRNKPRGDSWPGSW